MNNKKELLKKIKAAVLAGTVGISLTGCGINIDDRILEDLGINVSVETDENGNIKNFNVMKGEQETTTIGTQTTTEAPTTTTSTTSTTELTTQTTYTLPSETTYTTELATQTITTTTTEAQTTMTTTSDIDVLDIAGNIFVSPKNEYRITDEIYEITIDDTMNTLWKVASVYHPSDMSTLEFLEEIKELNNIENNFIYKGQKLKIPARLIRYNGNNDINSLAYMMDSTAEEICKLNNLPIEQASIEPEKGRELLIKVLPEGTISFKHQNGLTTYIYANTVINANQLIPCGRTYDEKATHAALVKYDNGAYNVAQFAQFLEDGAYFINLMAYNVERIYVRSAIPIFEARSMETCLELEASSEYIHEYYETAIMTNQPEIFHFYKDDKGNVCFTFDQTDLTRFGYTKADELAPNYFKDGSYFAQDKTRKDFRK